MLVGCMGHRPVWSKEAELDVLVRERDASEEAPLSGVHKTVIGMVAPAMADDH